MEIHLNTKCESAYCGKPANGFILFIGDRNPPLRRKTDKVHLCTKHLKPFHNAVEAAQNLTGYAINFKIVKY